MTLYPRFLLTFSKNKYNNTKFCNEEFLRVGKVPNPNTGIDTFESRQNIKEQCIEINNFFFEFYYIFIDKLFSIFFHFLDYNNEDI